jgi:hypothetical protein
MACDATCFCGSCLKKVRMFCPRTQRRGRRSCAHRHRIRTGSLRTEVSVAGKRNFQGRDKEAETALEIQGRRCRDKISLGNSANSGLIELRAKHAVAIEPVSRTVPLRWRPECQYFLDNVVAQRHLIAELPRWNHSTQRNRTEDCDSST